MKTNSQGRTINCRILWIIGVFIILIMAIGNSQITNGVIIDDNDGDGLSNNVEVIGWNVYVDLNGDGDIADLGEFYQVSSNPDLPDTNNDGLGDFEEWSWGTDPIKVDTDGDGLTDYNEIHYLGTNPLNPDTDGDGMSDWEELEAGMDPNSPDDPLSTTSSSSSTTAQSTTTSSTTNSPQTTTTSSSSSIETSVQTPHTTTTTSSTSEPATTTSSTPPPTTITSTIVVIPPITITVTNQTILQQTTSSPTTIHSTTTPSITIMTIITTIPETVSEEIPSPSTKVVVITETVVGAIDEKQEDGVFIPGFTMISTLLGVTITLILSRKFRK